MYNHLTFTFMPNLLVDVDIFIYPHPCPPLTTSKYRASVVSSRHALLYDTHTHTRQGGSVQLLPTVNHNYYQIIVITQHCTCMLALLCSDVFHACLLVALGYRHETLE